MQPPHKKYLISSGAGALRALALALGLAVTAPLFAQTAPAASVEGPTVKLEAFTVTGSNLRAGQSTGGANLRVATSVEVEQSGATSVSSFLKKSPRWAPKASARTE
jgi:outer membrane cobalamin receptor